MDQWERTLSRILEVIELILTVQRQWMYLENIFLGEDIRKQVYQAYSVSKFMLSFKFRFRFRLSFKFRLSFNFTVEFRLSLKFRSSFKFRFRFRLGYNRFRSKFTN